jgi:sugar phosphate permease
MLEQIAKTRNTNSWEGTMVAINLAAARPAVERSTMRKVYWRLLPLSILAYFLCYLDRINVGFAALTMNKDLGLDAATYGMAAGAFFWAISCSRCRATSFWKKSARGCGSPASW